MGVALDITQDWADGVYTFRLPVAQLEEHDEKCDAGPAVVLERLLTGRWRLPDIRETIRLGLIGGGTSPAEAMKLVRRYVDGQPLVDSVPVAVVILSVALRGRQEAPGDAPGKQPATESETHPNPETDGSTSSLSGEMPPPSASDGESFSA